jgi:RNA polymerase sigma-54 factor
MLKQSLDQKLLQKLSPQQIQMIKLLEIPTLQLEQRIKNELEENPVLEEGEQGDDLESPVEEEEENYNNDEEFSFEDYINDEDIPNYKLYSKSSSQEDKKDEIPFVFL